MKTDAIKVFVKLQKQLLEEKARLERRLSEINQALGQMQTHTPSYSVPRAGHIDRRGLGRQNTISLKKAVIQVLEKGPMTKPEILEAVQKIGYKFTSGNPMNYLGVILYGRNPKFINENGRFSLPPDYTGGGSKGA